MLRAGRVLLPYYPHQVVQRGHNRQVVSYSRKRAITATTLIHYGGGNVTSTSKSMPMFAVHLVGPESDARSFLPLYTRSVH